MDDIRICVRNELSELSGQPTIVCGNSGDRVVFDLDAPWEDYQVRCVRFVYKYLRTKKMYYEEVLFEGDTAEMPAVFNTDLVLIGLYAGADLSAELVAVPCCPGATDNDPDGTAPDPDLNEQLLIYLKAIEQQNANGFSLSDAAAIADGVMRFAVGTAEHVYLLQRDLSDIPLISCSFNDNTGAVDEAALGGKAGTQEFIEVPAEAGQICVQAETENGQALQWFLYLYDAEKNYLYSESTSYVSGSNPTSWKNAGTVQQLPKSAAIRFMRLGFRISSSLPTLDPESIAAITAFFDY